MPSRKHLDKKVREVQELQEYKLKDVPSSPPSPFPPNPSISESYFVGRYNSNDRKEKIPVTNSQEPSP